VNKITAALALIALVHANNALANDPPLSFGVVSQRSPHLTAQYWNPILTYVSAKSGVRLELKLGKTGDGTSAMVGRGEFDIVYTNHNFTPGNDAVGYKVIARPMEATITGQIVVLSHSPIRSLAQLQGTDVVFPSKSAFVGYYVPMNALLRAGIGVKTKFAGNQEGAMGQLKAGLVNAAGVNSQVMRDFAERENFEYRVLWSSEAYLNIPISVHPSVPKQKAAAVRDALVQMGNDPEGQKVLAESAALVKQDPPFGFVKAEDAEYENLRKFHRESLVKAE